MDRMTKARQQQIEKKLMTERGTPAQIMAKLGQPEQIMVFSSNSSKFKSAFGQDGSQIQPKRKGNNFSDSQTIDKKAFSSIKVETKKISSPPAKTTVKTQVQV